MHLTTRNTCTMVPLVPDSGSESSREGFLPEFAPLQLISEYFSATAVCPQRLGKTGKPGSAAGLQRVEKEACFIRSCLRSCLPTSNPNAGRTTDPLQIPSSLKVAFAVLWITHRRRCARGGSCMWRSQPCSWHQPWARRDDGLANVTMHRHTLATTSCCLGDTDGVRCRRVDTVSQALCARRAGSSSASTISRGRMTLHGRNDTLFATSTGNGLPLRFTPGLFFSTVATRRRLRAT